jgi:hypothetical protein
LARRGRVPKIRAAPTPPGMHHRFEAGLKPGLPGKREKMRDSRDRGKKCEGCFELIVKRPGFVVTQA